MGSSPQPIIYLRPFHLKMPTLPQSHPCIKLLKKDCILIIIFICAPSHQTLQPTPVSPCPHLPLTLLQQRFPSHRQIRKLPSSYLTSVQYLKMSPKLFLLCVSISGMLAIPHVSLLTSLRICSWLSLPTKGQFLGNTHPIPLCH